MGHEMPQRSQVFYVEVTAVLSSYLKKYLSHFSPKNSGKRLKMSQGSKKSVRSQKISPNIQKRPKWCQFVSILSEPSNCFWRHPNASERIRTGQNGSREVQTGPKTSENLQKLRKTCENFGKIREKFEKNSGMR